MVLWPLRNWLVPLVLCTAGCDFFDELKSAPTDTEATSGSSGGDTSGTEGDGPCEIEFDDLCLDQDTVSSCSPTEGTVSELDCPTLCGANTNFSCVATATGQHACWCVVPGGNKNLSCTELESCLAECNVEVDPGCTDRCFGRTDPSTIRLFGALVHCAEATCADTCRDEPAACNACLTSARVGGGGGCSLPRAVCDDDRLPDEPWP